MLRLVAIIADAHSPNGKLLGPLLSQLSGKARYVIGKDVGSFQSNLEEVEVIVHAAFAGGKADVVADLWPHCKRLRWIHSLSAGVDSLLPVLSPLPGSSEIPVTNAKGAFSRSLAEYSLGAMLHFNKQVPRLQSNRESRVWDKFIMNEMYSKTVGFVGFGDIAKATARLCKAFGMRIVALRQGAFDESGLADEVYGSADKLKVFEQDFVVCTLPGTPLTYHFCGEAEFAAMKKSAVFVSLGRGVCVDESALAAALSEGRIAGAALDVFETEPLPLDSKLWGCDNLLLSPHNADLTPTYLQDAMAVFMDRLEEFSAPDFSEFREVVDKVKGY